MVAFRPPNILVETISRTVLVTDARNSSKAYFSEKADEALIRIERDRALFAQIASGFGGEEVRDRGDGSMFVFVDPAAALKAAVAMQTEIRSLNEREPPESLRLIHRMGIHTGDLKLATTLIVLEGRESIRRKFSGDIVVTAARLEEICHPGEVCFSNDVYKAVRRSIVHPFRFLDSTLKGFDRPIRCWSTRIDLDWARPLTPEEEQDRQCRRNERRLREKWDVEQRERRREILGLRVALPVAVASIAFAAVQISGEKQNLEMRLDRAWTALLRSPQTRIVPDIRLRNRQNSARISALSSSLRVRSGRVTGSKT